MLNSWQAEFDANTFVISSSVDLGVWRPTWKASPFCLPGVFIIVFQSLFSIVVAALILTLQQAKPQLPRPIATKAHCLTFF